MSNFSLSEFQRLSGLSDSALLWLLKSGKLSLKLDRGALSVDFTAKDMESLIESLKESETLIAPELKEQLAETAAVVLREELGVMLEEALNKAQSLAIMRENR